MSKTSLRQAFFYAGRGVFQTLISERNMKIHACVAVCVVILGFIFSLSALEWCAIVICIGLVMGAECINTALEASVDLVSTKQSELAARAKDAAAGAVLLCACVSVVVGLVIFIPHIMDACMN